MANLRSTALGIALLLAAAVACGIDTDSGKRTRGSTAGAAGIAGASGSPNVGGSDVSIRFPEGGGAGELLEPDDACVADAVVGEHVPLDLYMMIDKSGSMRCRLDEANCTTWASVADSRWGTVTQALKGFIDAPENTGVGVGLGFFPIGNEKATCLNMCELQDRTCECAVACGCKASACACDSADSEGCVCTEFTPINAEKCHGSWYDQPAATIAMLPTEAARLNTTIDAQLQGGGTPTAGALEGALNYARTWASEHTARRVSVIFATDGEPDGCGESNTIENAVQTASAAFSGTPSIATYVIGVGKSLDNLNKIAAAGGTNKAYLLDAAGSAFAEFSQALNSIRGHALSCDYKIPNKSDLNFEKVNITVTLGGSNTANLIGQAASRTACADGPGWFYDDPKAPTQISLCKKTCDDMAAAAGSKLEVLMGCITERLDPR